MKGYISVFARKSPVTFAPIKFDVSRWANLDDYHLWKMSGIVTQVLIPLQLTVTPWSLRQALPLILVRCCDVLCISGFGDLDQATRRIIRGQCSPQNQNLSSSSGPGFHRNSRKLMPYLNVRLTGEFSSSAVSTTPGVRLTVNFIKFSFLGERVINGLICRRCLQYIWTVNSWVDWLSWAVSTSRYNLSLIHGTSDSNVK